VCAVFDDSHLTRRRRDALALTTKLDSDPGFQADPTTDVRLARTTKKPAVRPRVFLSISSFSLITSVVWL